MSINIEVIATNTDNYETIDLKVSSDTNFGGVISLFQSAFNKSDITYFEYIDEDDDSVIVENNNDLKTVFNYYVDSYRSAYIQGLQVKPLKVNVKSEKVKSFIAGSPQLVISLKDDKADSINGSLSGGKFIYNRDDLLSLTQSDQSSASSKSEDVFQEPAPYKSGVNSFPNISKDQVYQVGEIGVGATGRVMRALHQITQEMIAVKIIDLDGLDGSLTAVDSKDQIKNSILTELAVLKLSKSPFIIEYYGAYFVETSIHICTELMDGFSLDRYGIIDEYILGKLLVPIVNGMDYLWSNNIIHRDIKPSNMLINTSGYVKLCDFGISKQLIRSIAKTYTGTMVYMSPERLLGQQYNFTSDIWGLGISLGVLATGYHPILISFTNQSISNSAIETVTKKQVQLPISNVNPTVMLNAINQFEPFKPIPIKSTNQNQPMETTTSLLLTDFIGYCLQKLPNDRFSPITIKQHELYVSNLGDHHKILTEWVRRHSY